MGVPFTLSGELHCIHTMDGVFLIYYYFKVFLRLLHLGLFFPEKTEVSSRQLPLNWLREVTLGGNVYSVTTDLIPLKFRCLAGSLTGKNLCSPPRRKSLLHTALCNTNFGKTFGSIFLLTEAKCISRVTNKNLLSAVCLSNILYKINALTCLRRQQTTTCVSWR